MSYGPRSFGKDVFTIYALRILAFPVSDDGIEVPLNPPLFSDFPYEKLVVTANTRL